MRHSLFFCSLLDLSSSSGCFGPFSGVDTSDSKPPATSYNFLIAVAASNESILTVCKDVYSSTFTEQPSWDDLVGALSIIIWTLTLMVSIKYVFIVLAADDDGEGGKPICFEQSDTSSQYRDF